MTTGFVSRWKGKVMAVGASLCQFGAGAGQFGFSGNLSKQSSAAGVGNGADSTEDVLFSYSLPPNSLDQVGRQVMIEAWGSFANNTHSKHAQLYFGSELVDSGANTTAGGIGWYLLLIVTKTGPSTQTIVGQLIAGTVHGGCTVQSGAETDTSPITIKATGASGSSAAGDILCNALTVTALN